MLNTKVGAKPGYRSETESSVILCNTFIHSSTKAAIRGNNKNIPSPWVFEPCFGIFITFHS